MNNLEQNTINLFINQSHDIFMRFDDKLRHTYVSSTISKLFSYSPEEMINKTHKELNFSEEKCKFWEEHISNVFKSGESLRFEYFADTKFGKRTFLWKLFPEIDEHNNVISVLSLAKDITPYKIVTNKYNNLFHEMPDGYALHEIITDKDNHPIDYRFLEVNPAFENLTGLKADHIVGKRVLTVLPNIEKTWIEKYGDVALHGEHLSFRHFSQELEKYWEVTAFPNGTGLFVTIFKDITEINKTEILHSSIINSITDSLVIIEKDFTISWANENAITYFGKEMIGKKCFQVYHEQNGPCTRDCQIKKILQHGNKEKETEEFEYTIKTKFGEKTFLKKGVIISDHSSTNNSLLEISKDITEYKLNQKKLAHSEKMMAVGQLAGGIAHDFNNMLMAIQGFVNFARDTLDTNSAEHLFLTKALQASDRSANLVKQILTFCRQTKHDSHPMFILPIVKEALNLLDMSLTSSIIIERNLYSESNTIAGDPTTIHEIVVNLCTNAAHAMNGKGKIIVEHKEINIDNPLSLTTGILKSGTYSVLQVSDSGHGISKEIIKKIFDPFFTTKSQNEGTGMGLSVILGIVKNYGGEIEVESDINKGTSFKVYLPKSDNIELVEKNSNIHITKKNENILVIDDEEYLLETLEMMLNKLGYNPSCFTNPNSAMEEYFLNKDKYSCIISDNIMPELNGIDIISNIRKSGYTTPAILCTGFTSKLDSNIISDLNISTLLLKPFTIENISESLKTAINSTK